MSEVRHEPGGDGIADLDHDDRHRLRGVNRGTDPQRVLGNDQFHIELQEFRGEVVESFHLSVSEPKFGDDVSPFVPTEVVESLTKCGQRSLARCRRLRREHSDLHWPSRYLPLHSERRGQSPEREPAQELEDEPEPPHGHLVEGDCWGVYRNATTRTTSTVPTPAGRSWPRRSSTGYSMTSSACSSNDGGIVSPS